MGEAKGGGGPLREQRFIQTQAFPDVADELVVDFRVARDGLLQVTGGIAVKIMIGGMPNKDAPGRFKSPDKFFALHTAMALIW
jgi:hypothetical protein